MLTYRSIAVLILAVLSCVLVPSEGFNAVPSQSIVSSCGSSATRLGMFGGFKDAFKNDDTLGKPQSAGLSKGPKGADVTINGKVVPNVVVGQKVKDVARKARVKIQYSCQKGDCGTCTIRMNGRMVKACQEKIPSGKCVINTLD